MTQQDRIIEGFGGKLLSLNDLADWLIRALDAAPQSDAIDHRKWLISQALSIACAYQRNKCVEAYLSNVVPDSRPAPCGHDSAAILTAIRDARP